MLGRGVCQEEVGQALRGACALRPWAVACPAFPKDGAGPSLCSARHGRHVRAACCSLDGRPGYYLFVRNACIREPTCYPTLCWQPHRRAWPFWSVRSPRMCLTFYHPVYSCSQDLLVFGVALDLRA